MRNIKALELLNKGKIDELKAALEDEVYQDSLKGNTNAKKEICCYEKIF